MFPGRERAAGEHPPLDLHGHHVRGHGRAAVHLRSGLGRRVNAGRGVRAHVPSAGVHAGEHRARPAEHHAPRQQHAGQRPTSAVDRARVVPPDQPQRARNGRGRTAAATVNITVITVAAPSNLLTNYFIRNNATRRKIVIRYNFVSLYLFF